jgi:hypothetical protein
MEPEMLPYFKKMATMKMKKKMTKALQGMKNVRSVGWKLLLVVMEMQLLQLLVERRKMSQIGLG